MTTVTGHLLIWRRQGERYITGTCWDINKDVPFNKRMKYTQGYRSTFECESLEYFPVLNGHWEDHILCKFIDGNYFVANMSHQETLITPKSEWRWA